MAFERAILDVPGAIAGASFATGNGYGSTGQFLFCKLSAANTYIPCTATTDNPVGVSQNNPANADGLQLRIAGISKIVAGGTIAAGDEIGTTAQGKAIKKNPTATGAEYGHYVRGIALDAAASGELVSVYLDPYYRIH